MNLILYFNTIKGITIMAMSWPRLINTLAHSYGVMIDVAAAKFIYSPSLILLKVLAWKSLHSI